MTDFLGVNNVAVQQVPIPMVKDKHSNQYRASFKAENDQFIRQDQRGQSRPAIIQNSSPQAQMAKMLEQEQKEHKKKNFWNKFAMFATIGASLAIIASLFMRGNVGSNVGEFKMSNLEFKNFKNNKKIFNLKDSKSLHPDVRKFFTDMAEREAIAENIKKRAGTVGEAGTNAVILFGNSGVGKTELVKAYAKHVDADYVAVSLADFANSYTNGTAINMTKMFNEIATKAKANPKRQIVVSLDEIDAIIQRGGKFASEEVGKNRQSLITSLDKILEIPNIKLFASSNANINSLDPASVRRFGFNFTVPMPNKEQLTEALKFQLKECEGAMENGAKFFENNKKLDEFLEKLIKRECAFGDVKNIVKQAKGVYELEMSRANAPNLGFKVEYLDDALKNIEKTAGEMAKEIGASK